jgi:hypothetical protein
MCEVRIFKKQSPLPRQLAEASVVNTVDSTGELLGERVSVRGPSPL